MSKRNAHDFKCAQDIARINRDAVSEYDPATDTPSFALGGRKTLTPTERSRVETNALRERLGLRFR